MDNIDIFNFKWLLGIFDKSFWFGMNHNLQFIFSHCNLVGMRIVQTFANRQEWMGRPLQNMNQKEKFVNFINSRDNLFIGIWYRAMQPPQQSGTIFMQMSS